MGIFARFRRNRYQGIPRGKDTKKTIAAQTNNLDILTGAKGDGLDKALTARDLMEIGLVNFKSGINHVGRMRVICFR